MNLQNTPALDFVSKAASPVRSTDPVTGRTSGNGDGREGFPAIMRKLDDHGKNEHASSADPVGNQTINPQVSTPGAKAVQSGETPVDLQEPIEPETDALNQAENVQGAMVADLDQQPSEDPQLTVETLLEAFGELPEGVGTVENKPSDAILAAVHQQMQQLETASSPDADTVLAEEKSRLLEAFKNAAELSNHRAGTQWSSSQVQSAVESVMEAPAAVIQKLQHSLSNAPLLSKIMGGEAAAGNSAAARLEPAIAAAATMVGNLQQGNVMQSGQQATLADMTIAQQFGGQKMSATATGEQLASNAKSMMVDADQPISSMTMTQVSSQPGAPVSFLPVANLQAISTAVSGLQVSTEGLAATHATPVTDANAATQNTQRMTLQLVPKSLGVIEIALQRTDAGVSVVIQAQTADAERLLNTDRHALQEVMRNAGILVDEIKVATNPNLSEQFDTNRNAQQSLASFADGTDDRADPDGLGQNDSAGDPGTNDIKDADPGLLGPVKDARDGLYF